MVKFSDFLPFSDARPKKPSTKQAAAVLGDVKKGQKLYKIASIAQGFASVSFVAGSRSNFEFSPYDFYRIVQAIDTDSYVKQAFLKYQELIWKEGWLLMGENDEAVDYLHHRFDVMELAMRRPLHDVLIDVVDNMVKFSNGFLAKSRGAIDQFVKVPLSPVGKASQPISGYYVVPSETMRIARTAHNEVLGYQQDLSYGGAGTELKPPTWDPEEMVHLTVHRKAGRMFGTPIIVNVMDDILVLRQIEQDIQDLVHRELFPMYIYKIGTPEDPAQPEEIAAAERELLQMRNEGGLIVPERHEVEVLGAANKVLEAHQYLRYFQERVVVGLGLAPHHLGITMGDAGNRSMTDRLDVALYDKVKGYQRYVSEMIRIHILNELLMEGGFDPLNDFHDRVFFHFNEIDVETQIKKDQAILQKWSSNIIDQAEARMQLGEDPEVDDSKLLVALTARMAPDAVATVKTGTGSVKPIRISTKPIAADPGQSGSPAQPVPTKQTLNSPSVKTIAAPNDRAKPSSGGTGNPSNKVQRQVGNVMRPQNQYGRRNAPNVRHSIDESWLDEVVDLLDE